ncbi:hypothetical protein BN946_scf184845.g13 [Trametes cinnabarina]|uniref:WW domain-containing protein n=1 Tax=Pycnoporus cinnabarinus TaxID=5643 RepID=A0A060SFG7_PYCCI|nr:hypothetical protein BN946_scf184845.g13 [Trametes cinnabarina]
MQQHRRPPGEHSGGGHQVFRAELERPVTVDHIEPNSSATSTPILILAHAFDGTMLEDDGERVDWGNDEDEQQVFPPSDTVYSQRQTMGGYVGLGEDAEDAVSLGGDDEDEREFYARHSTEQDSVTSNNVLLSKSTFVSHSTSGKRDSQRQSATSSQRARTPSLPQNPDSPDDNLRRTHSASTLVPPPMTHALPPKPIAVPPLYRPPSPVRPGIRVSAMSYRQKKTNGSGKYSVAPDGGDPLPPDWEIRYPRNGGKDAYYFNVKTEESTWIRPRLPPSGRSSPTKDGEGGSARRSPDLQAPWPDRSGRGQGPRTQRRDITSRNPSPPSPPPPPANGSLTYQDRHYRPNEGAVPSVKPEALDKRDERSGTRSNNLSEPPHGRSQTPPQASDRRWRPRTPSPPRERILRRESSLPPHGDVKEAPRGVFRQTDIGWGLSQRQDVVHDIQVAPRSPPARRMRRKDDIEPPLRRRKDDIEPPVRRKDDIGPWSRRKDDIEPPIRRKDDIEPPLRRKEDIEAPLRPLPKKQPNARHENDEWPASRPPLREPSPPRRLAYPPTEDLLPPPSSSAREPIHYPRSRTPPPQYPPRDLPSNLSTDTLPLRRVRDEDDTYDNAKKRRLNSDEPGSSRHPPHDLPSPPVALPPKPSFSPEGPVVDVSHRRRAPLPPQDQQWREKMKGGPPEPPSATYGAMSAPGPAGQGARFGPPHPNDFERRPRPPVDNAPADRRENKFRERPDDMTARQDGRSASRDIDVGRPRRLPPHEAGEGMSRFEPSAPPPPDRMDIDVMPPSRAPPAPVRQLGECMQIVC